MEATFLSTGKNWGPQSGPGVPGTVSYGNAWVGKTPPPDQEFGTAALIVCMATVMDGCKANYIQSAPFHLMY